MSVRLGIDWDAQPLGEEPDSVIARRLGVSQHTALLARRTRGIPAFDWKGKHGIDWRFEMLGIDTDREIAERLGVSVKTVASARRRYGIKPPARDLPGTPKNRKLAASLRAKGWTYREIGDVIGVSEAAVRAWERRR